MTFNIKGISGLFPKSRRIPKLFRVLHTLPTLPTMPQTLKQHQVPQSHLTFFSHTELLRNTWTQLDLLTILNIKGESVKVDKASRLTWEPPPPKPNDWRAASSRKSRLTLRRCCSRRLRHPWLPPPCRSCLESKQGNRKHMNLIPKAPPTFLTKTKWTNLCFRAQSVTSVRTSCLKTRNHQHTLAGSLSEHTTHLTHTCRKLLFNRTQNSLNS